MSGIQPDQTGQRSAGLTLQFSSNNPFRNRAASPAVSSHSPTSPFDDPPPPPRPVSRNPFLDPANVSSPSSQPLISTADDDMATTATTATRPKTSAEELFDALTIDDKKPAPPPNRSGGPPRGPPPPMGRGGPSRAPGENMPPPGRRAPPQHRPTRSQEEALRARKMQGNGNLINFDSSPPQRKAERRPRRNSDSSVMSCEKPLTEEDRKQRELKRRERERRHRDNKDKPPKPSRRLDVIDQLDATSIYGLGLFHHDGPFDALNPHRNRQGSRRAPMNAFPKDSLNNSIGGVGPLNARPDHSTFMGHGEDEAFKEFSHRRAGEKSGSSSSMPPVFDPLSRGAILHGDETLGLGTSTFLEGTPAARTTIERRDAEKAADTSDGGLQRKKSLAQRIRNINRNGPRDFQPSGRMTNPDGAYMARRSPSADTPIGMATSASDRNPFFDDFDSKGEEVITVRSRKDSAAAAKSPSSPPRGFGLERRATTDATASADDSQQKQAGGGLLARVKSLKGGRRPPRPDGSGSGSAGGAAPPAPGREA